MECNSDCICGSVGDAMQIGVGLRFLEKWCCEPCPTFQSTSWLNVSATGRWSFKQVTLVFLGTGTMVVCVKHVGITDSDRERLKMSLASWSAHARSTHPGNPSVDLFKRS